MYNAITGIGGSGQLDSTVAANATVALLVAWAASSLTLVPPMFDVRTAWNWKELSDAKCQIFVDAWAQSLSSDRYEALQYLMCCF